MVHEGVNSRLRAVTSILVTQPSPTDPNSSYFKLAQEYGLKIDFRPFIQIQRLSGKEFGKQKIDILDHTAIIFTSRNAVDHFFNLCHELKKEIPQDMKYFTISDQTANYLQKYIVVRKRKIFAGLKSTQDLLEILKKHKSEKILFPCSNVRKDDIPTFLRENGYTYTEAIIYRTVPADLSDLKKVYYDMLAFYSPSDIHSLWVNFPDFQQKNTRIATFGAATAKAVIDSGLTLDIKAPSSKIPSMTAAIEQYVKKTINIKKK